MTIERRDFTLWRERDWRCEWWTVDGRPEVRLYFGPHQMSELADGPRLNLQQQIDEWLAAVRAHLYDLPPRGPAATVGDRVTARQQVSLT